jgi:hypothetical protein
VIKRVETHLGAVEHFHYSNNHQFFEFHLSPKIGRREQWFETKLGDGSSLPKGVKSR